MDTNRNSDTVTIHHSETDQEWHMLEAQLKVCSLVFSRMFVGDFEEATSKCVKIDVSPKTIETFVNLVEYPRIEQSFGQLAQNLNINEELSGLLDKYEVNITQLLVDLVEAKPAMKNILAVEKILRR